MSGIKVEFVAFAAPTPRAFSAWLRGADRGAVLPYHRGFLAVDVDTGAPGRSAHARQMLLEVADLARLASERGLVHLVQRRSEPGPFTYLAIKRRGAGCGKSGSSVYLRSQVAADG